MFTTVRKCQRPVGEFVPPSGLRRRNLIRGTRIGINTSQKQLPSCDPEVGAIMMLGVGASPAASWPSAFRSWARAFHVIRADSSIPERIAAPHAGCPR